MANNSDANGVFEFNFSKTDKSAQECAQWLKDFASEIAAPCYDTNLEDILSKSIDELQEQLEKNQMQLASIFWGNGRWHYDANIEWFKTDSSYSEYLKAMPNLNIAIHYDDYDVAAVWAVFNAHRYIEVVDGIVEISRVGEDDYREYGSIQEMAEDVGFDASDYMDDDLEM